MDFIFKVKFGIKWKNIDVLRNTIVSLLYADVTDQEYAHQVAMACTELMENACKYAEQGPAMLEIVKDVKNSLIIIKMYNITSEKNIDMFKNIYSMVMDGTPEEAYKSIVMRSLEMKGASQLGLARIRYELNTGIEYEVIDDMSVLLPDKAPSNNDEWVILKICLRIPTKISKDYTEVVR